MKKSIAMLMSFVLLLGGFIPYESLSAKAPGPGVRSAEGIRVASGASHSLMIQPNGTVVAWGNNSHRQSDVPSGLTNVTAVAAGAEHSLALTSEGEIFAWGNNALDQLSVPEEAAEGRVVSIAAGGNHSLALMADGTVLAWGFNNVGQTDVPPGLTNVKAISAGYQHSLALKSDGSVVAWGHSSSNLPGGGLDDVTAIAAGTYHSLALKSDGTVVAWGNNNQGQSTVPVELASGGVIALAAGDHHSLALRSDGTIVAWGDNSYRQLEVASGLTDVVAISAGWDYSLAIRSDGTIVAEGDPSRGQTAVPAGLWAPTKGKRIAAGYFYSYALKSDGTLAGWGSSIDGQLDTPSGLDTVTAIASGASHNLALRSNGTVVSWGYNFKGQANVPVGLEDVVSVAAGSSFSVALQANGKVVAWGDHDLNRINVPADLDGVVAIASGFHHTLALKSDGTVVAWGVNGGGRSDVPADLQDVVAIAAGNEHSLALKSDGTVVSWGSNSHGQSTVPAELRDVVAIAAGGFHSLALKSNGTVIAWGFNNSGQTSVPADLMGVTAIAAGMYHSLALKSDGTVAAWGDDSGSQSTVPGNARLSHLGLLEGDFTASFDPSVTSYTYYYDGQSPTSAHVTPTLESTVETELYVDYERLPSGSTTTINLAGATTDTIVPVRVEPYLLPGQTYTMTLEIDATEPQVHFGTNGRSAAETSAASEVTVTDTQSGVVAASLEYTWTQSRDLPVGGWAGFANGDTLSRTSGEGDWYLHIRAADAVGNVGHTVSDRFVLKHIPDTPILSSNAELAEVVLNASGQPVEMSPAFTSGTTTYTAETDAEQVELRAVPAHWNAVATWEGERIGEKATVPLSLGLNEVTITVRAENGTVKTYTLTIIRHDNSEPPLPGCTFTDIQDHWAKPSICEAAELGIVEGVSAKRFLPDGYVTRTELAAMLLRTLQLPTRSDANELVFSDEADVPEWAEPAIRSAVAEGILEGYPDGTLRPLAVVNRSEMAAMLSKAMNWETPAAASTSFSDSDVIPAWAIGYIEAAREHGLVEGRGGNAFMPAELTTRAEAAVVLLRLWHKLN